MRLSVLAALLASLSLLLGCGSSSSSTTADGGVVDSSSPRDGHRAPDGHATADGDKGHTSHDARADAGADSGHEHPDSGHEHPDSGHEHPDSGHEHPDSGHTTGHDAGHDSGFDAPTPGDADPFELYDAGPPVVATTDSDGWSVLPGMPGTDGGYARAIYVDSVGGSESNTGDSPSSALQGIGTSSTLNHQLSTAPAGQSIVVVLKPGSSWTTSPADQMNPPIGGSASFPLLITGSRWPGATTGARPRIGGMIYLGHSHVAVEGLEIGPGSTSGFGEGIHIPSGGETDFLIEDNLITNYPMNIEITGSPTTPVTNVRIRRNYLFGACGSGAVVAFDGNDVAGMLFEENFFDWNGGTSSDCNYVNTNLHATYTNILAHDVYFADDGTRVVALDVTFRRNLFSRTLQSVKGPYTGTMDDNLFYDYLSGGYIGTWGGAFTNNVLIDGGGFGTGLDNNHSPNELPLRQTLFCNNLHYNEGSPYTPSDYAFVSSNAAGVSLAYHDNVIDGFDRAFQLSDSMCFGYDVSNNIVQTNSFWEIYQPWPQARCPSSFSGNDYYSPQGDTSASGSGYGLELPGTSMQYQDFAAAEAFLHEQNGVFESAPFAFADPTRNIGSYLVSASLGTGTPTLIDYLTLVQAQSQTFHTWNAALGVQAINEYLRAGHSLPTKPLSYNSGCP
jgi:hypothetical protein